MTILSFLFITAYRPQKGKQSELLVMVPFYVMLIWFFVEVLGE